MIDLEPSEVYLDDLCGTTPPDADHAGLIAGVARLLPDLSFHRALTRTGWHRIGGVVDEDGERIAFNLRQWAETESDHDMFALYERFADAGYLTTRFDGRTHYFVAPMGDRAPNFVQLEVEEIVEVVDRPLFVDDEVPDDIEELLDPPGAFGARLEPMVLAPPRYIFRAITDVADLVAEHVTAGGSDLRYIRFLEEWDRSSAGDTTRFCDHFILRLLPFQDRFGEQKVEATPLPIDTLAIPKEGIGTLSGRALADYLTDYDKAAGFPMAWYFAMVLLKKTLTAIPAAVFTDVKHNYRYLPERDIAVLEGWMHKPYSF